MSSKLQRLRPVGRLTSLALAVSLTPLARAALTDVAQEPLLVSYGTPVKPNLLFVIDNSGSMADRFLPEAAGRGFSRYSIYAAQCNGMAFKESENYPPAVNHDGTSRPAGVISTALSAANTLSNVRALLETNTALIDNGSLILTVSGSPQNNWYTVGEPVTVYNGGSTGQWMLGRITAWHAATAKLTIAFDARSGEGTTGTSPRIGRGWPPFVYYTYKGAQPTLGWTYTTTGAVVTSTTFYEECNSLIGSNPGANVFERKIMRSTDAKAQDFANWWAHYGDRMKLMKTVTAQAFLGIDATFRVGFSRILTTQAKESGTSWLHIRDFEKGAGGQREKFYNALYATTASGTTPLRGSLALSGQYFANKAPGQDYDPVQYSCQKNFTILASDGEWNTGAETGTFGPYDLYGAQVGQRDGSAARPMRDTKDDGTGGTSNTLADVAMYYYETDLRTAALGNCTGAEGKDVCDNDVPVVAGSRDTAKHQHMTTFTLSLGQIGSLRYCTGYETGCDKPGDTSDYPALVTGAKLWPSATNSTSAASRIDDLWHAAVNGRGTFFNASDASGLGDALKAALSEIEKVVGRGAAGATSTMQPVAGDNSFFIASFTSGSWHGDLKSHSIDPNTYEPKMDTPNWSASDKLPAAASRKIYYAHGGNLREFTFANLTADGAAAQFQGRCASMSHYLALGAADRTSCDSGANLVSFLRGEEFDFYRTRAAGSKLGDIVGSAPTFDGKHGASFKDDGYAAFVKDSRATRAAMVYVGSNGGKLHAFDAATGVERWAFIPSAVRSRLWTLADKNYSSQHEFFVDGPPVTEDVFDGSAWRTILVAGLGAGGRSYVALDVTKPLEPKLLWEFTNSNLGLTFAKPVIAKRANGKWVVVVPSGFNNVGDGQGRLFMLDAITGAVLESLSTGVGSVATPAGLGPITPWIEDGSTDATALRYYAGDNLGNVWRFDPDGLLGPTKVVKLAELKKDGVAQPVTTPPVVGLMRVAGVETPVVGVGTGRLVGKSDLSDAGVQSVYAIKDNLGAGWGDVRAGGLLVAQTLTTDGQVRKGTAMSVEWKNKAGWVADLPDQGERINTPMVLFGSTLVAASNVPTSVAGCDEGNQGHAWIYYFDLATGAAVADFLGESMVAGINVVGRGVLPVPSIASKSIKYREIKQPTGTATTPRRANWREVVDR
ncbi:MAG: pilus assembly protein [Inhella sp.]